MPRTLCREPGRDWLKWFADRTSDIDDIKLSLKRNQFPRAYGMTRTGSAVR
jgi:hypothetical protein